MNKFDLMREAVAAAQHTMFAAHALVRNIASMIIGNLHWCNTDDLRELKAELKNFNAHTGKWNR